ncbi:type I-F CRISPR-associated protein Csy2 [Moraxella sp. FZLJ2107]|uniref:type I-F CRISPR-associated protein Csy2 n=1 Tax=unclassified Moraxella TaxID=2685852 RepID=UPI0020C8AA1A|nr:MULTISPECIES: type I-F CRISPR-associated protein Csy2 [unclassified Moraxella]UTO04315.1 type I-F CRISPR-associated protein Csy2 [Moraxella sp. FZLJ2107]UTO23148.1 type I-F CRISPR-associated protein Csy2 [Moraxella sp. FZLJ2109]
MSKRVVGYALLHKVVINNANAISSPITFGFPAGTGFTGAIHALSRTMMADERFANLSLGGVLLACFDCTPKIYRESPYRDYTFNQTRNPLKKDGSTASIVEEGKCNLVMSFVIELLADDLLSQELSQSLCQFLSQAIFRQRVAGGSVMGIGKRGVQYISSVHKDEIIALLMPAFVLMDASDEFAQLIDNAKSKNPSVTSLDVLLDVCTLHHIPELDKDGNTKWHTESIKTGHGWLVPMPIGYQAISEIFQAGKMANVRNLEYPSQYVEAIYGLGKWVYPHHLKDNIDTAFWRQAYDETGLYFITQANLDKQQNILSW